MARLTEAKRKALTQIVQSPRKSGRFWFDLGVSPKTISALEDDGLVGALYRPATGETSIFRRSWYATERGRLALEQSSRDGGENEK